MRKHRTTMYRNGSSWTISRWDESVNCYRLTEGKTYWQARAICGEDNRRVPKARAGQLVKLEIDEQGDIVNEQGEVIMSKRYGYDSEDADVVAQMVEAYNQREAKS
jgi:hypothetical protein